MTGARKLQMYAEGVSHEMVFKVIEVGSGLV